MALDMDVADIISLCKGSKELNEKLCKNRALWINRLNRDFPEWANKTDKKEQNLPQLYQVLLLDRDFNGWKQLPEKEKKDFQTMYKTLLNIKNIKLDKDSTKLNLTTKYFISKLEMVYPDTDFLSVYILKGHYGKGFYGDVMEIIKLLKEKYNYTYIDGNPFVQEIYLKAYAGEDSDYRRLLTHSLTYQPSLSVIKYCIDKGVEITSNMIEDLDMYSDVGLPYSKNIKTYLEARELMEKHLK